MSFDLFLEHFKDQESAPVSRERIREVLRRHGQRDDRFEFVEFTDGSHFAVNSSFEDPDEEFTGCSFNLRHFSEAIMMFVFEVAAASDMVIFNAQGMDTPENPVLIVLDPAQIPELPELDYQPVVCASPAHLAQLLGVGFASWEAYRDRVVGNQGEHTQ
ncbi:MAG: hypothetical protein LBU11_09890 [Zoogloeaceae bacterium]|nr:hypothetical protein [Zoogloeaceae bacterium]